MEVQGRNVVITGAAGGIGRALAERVAAEGPGALVLADVDRDAVHDVAARCGTAAVAVTTDVSREDEIQALIRTAREQGPVDVFCSNAGVAGFGGGPETPDSDWELGWRVNVMAHIWAARALVPEMLARGDGYLVNVASAAGLLTQVSAMTYSVTKHAAVAAAEWLAITYGDAGIKVSCVCPLAVRTPMLERGLEDPVAAAALLSNQVLEPSDVAEAIIAGVREERFLILPHAAVAEYVARKGADPERWLRGMRRLVRRAQGDAA
jgi:NAD(P)-dependent dehydrogenase (short-subunit alcohol dehydrogenase family)